MMIMSDLGLKLTKCIAYTQTYRMAFYIWDSSSLKDIDESLCAQSQNYLSKVILKLMVYFFVRFTSVFFCQIDFTFC